MDDCTDELQATGSSESPVRLSVETADDLEAGIETGLA